MRRSFKLILVSFVCLTCGCAGFSEYRKGRIAERQAEQTEQASSVNFDSLWKQGYGYNNPNSDRREQGLGLQNFDGSLNSDKKKDSYFYTLFDDAITHGVNTAVKSMIVGTRRLFNRE